MKYYSGSKLYIKTDKNYNTYNINKLINIYFYLYLLIFSFYFMINDIRVYFYNKFNKSLKIL